MGIGHLHARCFVHPCRPVAARQSIPSWSLAGLHPTVGPVALEERQRRVGRVDRRDVGRPRRSDGATMALTESAPAQPRIVDGATWRERLLVPELVAIGLAVAVVSSLGSPMVPTIADDYDVSLGTSQWALTSALLAGAVVTPVLGRLDRKSTRLNSSH